MSIEKDFTTDAMPSFTCSMTVAFSSECVVVLVEDAASPANLHRHMSEHVSIIIISIHPLVRHNNQKPFLRKLIRLQLIVDTMDPGAAGQEKQQFRRRVRVIGWFGYVDFDVAVFGDFLSSLSTSHTSYHDVTVGGHTPVGAAPAARFHISSHIDQLYRQDGGAYELVCQSRNAPTYSQSTPSLIPTYHREDSLPCSRRPDLASCRLGCH